MAGIPHHMTGWGGGAGWAWPVSCHIHTQGAVRVWPSQGAHLLRYGDHSWAQFVLYFYFQKSVKMFCYQLQLIYVRQSFFIHQFPEATVFCICLISLYKAFYSPSKYGKMFCFSCYRGSTHQFFHTHQFPGCHSCNVHVS